MKNVIIHDKYSKEGNMKYFVRYTYKGDYNNEINDYDSYEESDIISTEEEFEDIYEVKTVLKGMFTWKNLQEIDFDIISLNKL